MAIGMGFAPQLLSWNSAHFAKIKDGSARDARFRFRRDLSIRIARSLRRAAIEIYGKRHFTNVAINECGINPPPSSSRHDRRKIKGCATSPCENI